MLTETSKSIEHFQRRRALGEMRQMWIRNATQKISGLTKVVWQKLKWSWTGSEGTDKFYEQFYGISCKTKVNWTRIEWKWKTFITMSWLAIPLRSTFNLELHETAKAFYKLCFREIIIKKGHYSLLSKKLCKTK